MKYLMVLAAFILPLFAGTAQGKSTATRTVKGRCILSTTSPRSRPNTANSSSKPGHQATFPLLMPARPPCLVNLKILYRARAFRTAEIPSSCTELPGADLQKDGAIPEGKRHFLCCLRHRAGQYCRKNIPGAGRGGVPVVRIGSTVIRGYNPDAVLSCLGR